jgi:hypothetical protein
MIPPEPPRRGSIDGPSRFLWGLEWGWLSPVLLLSVPVQLLTSGREGLWLLLLVFVAPLLALFLIPAATVSARNHHAGALIAVAMILIVGTVLWANLTLAGDVAVWLGRPRWSGPLLVGGATVVLVTLRGNEKSKHLLVPVALLGLLVPLLAILWETDPAPPRVWSRVASQPVFRFPAHSPWVTEGRTLTTRPGVDTLGFQEEHRLIPLTEGPLRVVISDRGRARVEELSVTPGQPVILRPGDRLQVDAGARFRFEGGKRIPGAPSSGITWADAPLRPRGLALLKFLGLGFTLVGGAVVLLTFGQSGPLSRGAAGFLGLIFLVMVLWGECWAVYTAAYAPEIFLGRVTSEKLLELPALALRGQLWGRWLVGIVLVGLLAGFLASAAALRQALAQLEGKVPRNLVAWGGLVAVAGLASLWPLDPWTLVLLAFGLGASTLAPLAVVGVPVGRPRVATLATTVGFVLFVGLAAVGRLSPAEGNVILAFPALIAAPAASGILWLARRLVP